MNQNTLCELKSQKAKNRYEQIISVALELFLSNGFENTSLNEIISKSGGSLSTIYKHFGNKEGLFKAIIDRGVSKFSQDINKKICLDSSEDLEYFLHKFSEEYLAVVLTKESFLLKRLIFSESFNKDSQISKIFYESDVKIVNKILVDFFSKPTIKTKFKNQDFELLAFRFCYLLEEPYSMQKIVFGHDIDIDKIDKKQWIDECVDFFLRGALK
ncbi:multidrug efflux system CmeABC transcriptional regulator, TetR family [Campylobacter iguaniorum]|uniref:TetR/AcrR family transcriptional regulator n=1 Tax=Campylobacter iguaniorum TaxID=1244531 RepID=UPI000739FEEE|nr:TetR/AcrR family transcriptional regulator [Campylobacter iguaniorum]ALV23750.1 multidrug efflux system CmeABC transcriptional regulator, TetR family [Campylobacter iguaniorum]